MTISISSAEYVRRGLLKISSSNVLDVIDTLDLRPTGKINPVIGVPLRNLQQKRDVQMFASTAPIAAVKAVLEILALEPMEQIIEALGDNAELPTFDQMSVAIDQLIANGSTADDIVALMAFAIGEEFPAGPHCQKLFEERTEFALPELPEGAVATTSFFTPKVVDPAIKEQRQARKEAEKKKKKRN